MDDFDYDPFYEYNPETDETTLPTIDEDPSNLYTPDTGFSGITFDNPQIAEDGTELFQQNDGSYVDANGVTVITSGGNVVPGTSYTGFGGAIPGIGITRPPSVLDQLSSAVKKTFTNPDQSLNIAKLLQAGGGALGGLAGLLGVNRPTITPSGYQGGIPQLTAIRTAIPQPTRTPYTGKPSMGTRHFTDTQYVSPTDVAATRTYQQELAQQIGQLAQQPVRAAQGGLMAAKGRYLRGNTDGMADQLNTSIEGKQPAKLSHGEFVVPADVVSHLGNGNSDAGAKKLYQMMDRIRVARTGTKKQGKQINPDNFMPGGKVGYAEGGIAKFQTGGLTSGAPSGTALSSGLTGTEASISNWAAPYVTNMLAQGQAIANSPFQAYTGQLTAGVSPLQQQAFQGAQGLSAPAGMGGFTPKSFTSQGTAQQYMNPYLQQALDPQLAEARRQSQITQTQNAGKLTGAGAYGGGRQAIMDAETQRNLGTTLADITGRGYMSAYDKATQQFNAEQQAAQQAQNLTNQYGLEALRQQAQLGQTQRGIEAEDVAAQKAQFEEERVNPYKMVQLQSSLLGGLPLAAQTYNTAQPSWLQSLSQGAVLGTGGINAILETLGIIPPTRK